MDHLLYVFALFPLVHKMLLKIHRDKAAVTLVAPAWPHQLWFTMLQELSVDTPISLSLVLDLITQDCCWLHHSNLKSLHLTTWKLHGETRWSSCALSLLRGWVSYLVTEDFIVDHVLYPGML